MATALAREPLAMVSYRVGKAADRAYVARTWVRAYAHTDWGRDTGRVYAAEHPLVVASILERGAELRVAHVIDDEDAILGFAVTEGRCIHYVYVRVETRRLGIARTLLGYRLAESSEVLEFSHRPQALGLKLPPRWTYNPYRAFRG